MKWTAATDLYPDEFDVPLNGTAAICGRECLVPAIEKFLFALELKIIGADYLDLSALDIASVKS